VVLVKPPEKGGPENVRLVAAYADMKGADTLAALQLQSPLI